MQATEATAAWREGAPVSQAERPAPSDPLLRALVARAQDGDTAAFDGLMQMTERRVAGLAYRLLGSRDQAREAVQEVFLRVFRSLHRFRIEGDLYAWLFRITVNVSHDVRRKAGRHVSLEEEREAGRVAEPSAESDSEDRLLHAERWRLIGEALSTLPAGERNAIVLRDVEGLSTEDVARVLGIRPTTIRSQISTAREKVRRHCARILGGKESRT